MQWRTETTYYKNPNNTAPAPKWINPHKNEFTTHGEYYIFNVGDDSLDPSIAKRKVEIAKGPKDKYYLILEDDPSQDVTTLDEGVMFFGPITEEANEIIVNFLSLFEDI